MKLAEKINDEIKRAMLAKDKQKLEALRAIKAALLIAKTGKDMSSGEIPETVELQLLQRLVKQRKESAGIYKEQNRADLAEEELFQAAIIEKFLPQQMGEDEIRAVVKKIVDETGAQSIKDMGKVMGAASKQLVGKADNRIISEIIKEMLQ
ncbi:MAG TPA: GatB/YqeY domain-containing protein [Bacteroidales bacterium]|nr:GatB/YqeY domain-containing protein [Bacteroidales bacterium]